MRRFIVAVLLLACASLLPMAAQARESIIVPGPNPETSAALLVYTEAEANSVFQNEMPWTQDSLGIRILAYRQELAVRMKQELGREVTIVTVVVGNLPSSTYDFTFGEPKNFSVLQGRRVRVAKRIEPKVIVPANYVNVSFAVFQRMKMDSTDVFRYVSK